MNKQITLGKLDHWIDGAAVVSSGDYLDNVNPMTGGPGVSVAAGTGSDVDAAVAAAKRAADGWRRFNAAERGRLMMGLANKMREQREELAQMERADTGKPMPMAYADASNDMRIAQEEIFGPVGVVFPFDTEEDAIRIANDSDYGLIGTVWSQNISRALRVADRIEAGQIFINVWNTMSVQTPFGGYKNSGYGREKGIEAIHHYAHLKTVTVKIWGNDP